MWNLFPNFSAYFGLEPGGANLRAGIGALPTGWVERFRQAIGRREAGGRVLFMGNGGSFDNARLMAAMCRACGIAAKTPGHSDDYLATALTAGYGHIFTAALEADHLTGGDIVVGISGSGNSENVLAALDYARQRGARTFCLSGGDGGRMGGLGPEADCLIAATDCMEAIEDLHVMALRLVLTAQRQATTIEQARAEYLARFDVFLCQENLRALAEVGGGLLDTVIHSGQAFILGTGIGAHHVRADLLRGATNTLPIRGLNAPECFTMNSAQATANDDGLDFLLADGLAKFRPGPGDFALLCQGPLGQADRAQGMLQHCRELLATGGTPLVTVGNEGVDVSMFPPEDFDLAVTMVGHAASVAIRQTLQKLWKVRPLAVPGDYPAGQRKLGVRGTMELEKRLRDQGMIDADEQVTFAYGRGYASRRPEGWPEERCYF